MNFVKVMAPVIPFLCDKIYTNLALPMKGEVLDSIHLCDFPSVDTSCIDESIIEEVDTIIQIVSLSRSARNKANIKIRQPLSELALFADKNIQDIALNNENEILEELNIKSLKLVKNESELVQYSVKPNFPVMGQKYGKEVSRITSYLSKVDNDKIIHYIRSDKPVVIKGDDGALEILPEELILEEIPLNSYGISSGKNIIVGVYTKISKELKQEGMVRDLIRKVQNLRKDSGLKVEDRIEIGILGSKELNAAVQSHESYFMNEVLGVKLDMKSAASLTFNDSIKIDGKKITIGISPTH